MKLNLKKSLMMHEAFMHKVNEDAPVVVDNPTAKVDHRQSMMQDVDTIITSLEALSKNIYEEFEQDLKEVNEEDEKSVGSKLADWLIYAKKYKKMQGRINQMKMNSYDLSFASSREKDPSKKAAASEKKKQVDAQVKELQAMVDQKVGERGKYVKKVLNKTKLEGQFALIKHMTGLEDDPNKTADLKKRMKEVGERIKDEEVALRKLEKQKEKGAKGDKKYKEDKAAAKAAPTKESYIYESTLTDIYELDIIELQINEGLIDFLKGASRFKKIQKRINQMKMNAFDLGFAAANLGRSAEVADKVSALNAKKKMIEDQIDELQAMLNDRIKEKTPYVKKAVEVTRMDGQMALIKHMTGLSDDPGKKADLSQRMSDLKARQEEETAAMLRFKDAAAADEVDVKGDDELIALKSELDAAKEAKGKIDKADKVKIQQAEVNILDLQMRIKATQGDTAGVQDIQAKVIAAQKKLADLQAAPEPAPASEPAPAPASEPAPASAQEPAPAPVSEETPEVKAAKAKIAEYEQAIADLSAKTDKASKDKVAMLTAAAASQRKSLQQLLAPKESLMARAYDLNLQEMVIYINEKENWQLDNTSLYVTINNQIRTAEMNSSLNESIFNTSVKDRMSKLL